MQKHYDEISGAGAEILAISTDNLAGAESIVSKAVAEFPVLYTSKNNDVPISYNVFDLFGDGLASASVFIVDKDGNLAYENIGNSYRHQVSGDEVLRALAEIAG